MTHTDSPMVSIRVSLRWPPAPAFENTDTLIITGRSGFFIDLRVFNSSAAAQKGQIDWASAGQKNVLPGSTPENPLASFSCLIDSRRAAALAAGASAAEEGPPDEGSFTTLENGDVLETGSMANPDEEGAPVMAYEEVWRRLPLPDGGQTKVVLLESVGEEERTYVGRVGKWELGLRDGKEGFWATRWEEGADGEWELIYCVGGERAKGAIPRLPREGIEGKTGEVVEWEGRRWNVKENA